MSTLCLKRLFLPFVLVVSAVSLKNNSLCKDTSDECKAIGEKCGDLRHSWLLNLKCPKTCNSCVPKTKPPKKNEKCKDVHSNCDKYLGHCSLEKYRKLMTEFCPLTCSFCQPPKKQNVQCRDSIDHCDELVLHGFCENSALSVTQKRDICGRSCNLCN